MERSDYSESSGDSVMDVEFSGIDTRSVFVDPPPRAGRGPRMPSATPSFVYAVRGGHARRQLSLLG